MSIDETTKGRVLVVDDDVAMADYLVQALNAVGFVTQSTNTGDRGVALANPATFDVVLTDLRMRGLDGIEVCRRIRERTSDLPVILLTAFGDYAAAVEAVRAGAYDFLAKPVKLEALQIAIGRAVEQSRLRREVKRLEQSVPPAPAFGNLVGDSTAMRKLYELLRRVVAAESPVLITGESGTGKELIARALHAESPRKAAPFVALDCAAMPEAMLEVELFGRDPSAASEDKTPKPGAFLAAAGGTLYLEDVGELPLPIQAKLLRTLAEGVIRPVGANADVPVNVRVVAATNRDLETAVEEKRFREELYFRLNVIEIAVPPLRLRENDVVALAMHFLGIFGARIKKPRAGLTPEVAKKLVAYPWPGNVRELRNTIERAVAVSAHDRLTVDDLPEKIANYKRAQPAPVEDAELVTLEEMERRYVMRVLEATGGSKTAAARTLGLDRTTLWRKLERIRGAQAKGADPNSTKSSD